MSNVKESRTYELTLILPSQQQGAAEVLESVLISLGLNRTDIAESYVDNKLMVSVYFKQLKLVNQFKKKLEGLSLKNVTLSKESLKDKDWQLRWKKDFKPFVISERFIVIPAWLRGRVGLKRKKPLFIDSTVAFGTGMHPTTRCMVQFIDELAGRYGSFLDIGTGTGILAVAAAKSGAENIDAIDISPDSVATAAKNLKYNKIFHVVLHIGNFNDLKLKKSYDFVAANMTTHDLLQLKKKILKYVRPGKFLAVSGISLKNYPMFKKGFEAMPLRCLRTRKEDGWAALLYQRLFRQ